MSIILTWLWQGVLVAAATAAALRSVPRASAETRHAAWWVALAAILGIPLALVGGEVGPAVVVGQIDGSPGAIVLPSAPSWAGVAFAAAWAVMAVAGLLRVARRWRAARALARRSAPFDVTREAQLPLWSQARAAARRPAELRVSDDIGGACAIGHRRPIVVVGRRLAERLDDTALDLIVLHEQAHLARRDDVLHVLQACILAVAGWHPAVWWVSRRIDLEREAACDDYVLARTAGARHYASALLHAAAAQDRRSLVVVPAIATAPSALRVRVARLFDARRSRGRPRPLAALAITLPLAAVVGAPQFASLIVFVDHAAIVAPPPAASPPPVAADTVARDRERDSTPMAQRAVEQPGRTIPVRRRHAAPRDVAPGPDAPVAARAQFQAAAVTPTDDAAHTEQTLPSSRGHSPALGMAAQAVDPQPSALFEALASDTSPRRAPWESFAAASSGAATVTATAVADRARRGALSVGRAFTRAGKGFAGTF